MELEMDEWAQLLQGRSMRQDNSAYPHLGRTHRTRLLDRMLNNYEVHNDPLDLLTIHLTFYANEVLKKEESTGHHHILSTPLCSLSISAPRI
jgi:hypothetical protein